VACDVRGWVGYSSNNCKSIWGQAMGSALLNTQWGISEGLTV
jgi:hypothetical protein